MTGFFKALPFLGKFRFPGPVRPIDCTRTNQEPVGQSPAPQQLQQAPPLQQPPQGQETGQTAWPTDGHTEQMKQHTDLIAKLKKELQEQSQQRREPARKKPEQSVEGQTE